MQKLGHGQKETDYHQIQMRNIIVVVTVAVQQCFKWTQGCEATKVVAKSLWLWGKLMFTVYYVTTVTVTDQMIFRHLPAYIIIS
jgi:hypothetical protein